MFLFEKVRLDPSCRLSRELKLGAGNLMYLEVDGTCSSQ